MTRALKSGAHLSAARHVATYAERPGFRIVEILIAEGQEIPWHSHSNITDTMYVLDGDLVVSVREPMEEVELGPGDTCVLGPGRPHRIVTKGPGLATFLVLQGLGEYDFVPGDSSDSN